MKSVTIGLITLTIALFAIACGNSDTVTTNQSQPVAATSPVAKATVTPDEFSVARANYAKHCSACHGDEGKGGLVKVDDKKLKVPSLREGHALGHPDEKFVKQITNGGDGMPKFSDKLSPEEINAMVRFVRHEFQGKN